MQSTIPCLAAKNIIAPTKHLLREYDDPEAGRHDVGDEKVDVNGVSEASQFLEVNQNGDGTKQ